MKTIINNNIKKHPVVGKKNISMLALWDRKNSEKRVFGFQTLEVQRAKEGIRSLGSFHQWQANRRNSLA